MDVAAPDPRLVIDVDNLPAEGWSFHDAIPAERVAARLHEGAPADDLEVLTPLDADLRAYAAGEGLRLEGRYSVTLNRPCGRCLQPAPLPLRLRLAMTLFPAGKAPAAPAQDAAEDRRGARRKAGRGRGSRERDREDVVTFSSQDLDDVDTATFTAGKVHVEDILREAILLEVPFTNLCRADCQGLCQACGADLNLGPCGCTARPVDPRLAALANIKLN